MKKRGQSQIIVIILIILVSFVSFLVLYNVFSAFVKSSSEDVNVDVFSSTFKIQEVKLNGITNASVRIKRLQGDSDITNLRFIFYDTKGESYILDRNGSHKKFETLSYELTFEELDQLIGIEKIDKISVFPLFDERLGIETKSNNVDDARNLALNGNAETGDTTGWDLNSVSTDSHTGNYSFYLEGPKLIKSNDYIPINVDKAYYQEGWFKSPTNSRLYFGYIPYDEQKREIRHEHVNYFQGTETELYESIEVNDKIIKIKNGTNWVTGLYNIIAYNVDDSGNYNDLPNFKLSNRNIIRVQEFGLYWEVEFATSVGSSFPAGTKIREHFFGGTNYMYNSASGVYLNNQWTQYNSTISGESQIGETTGMWKKGTRFVKIIVIGNYLGSSSDNTFMDNIRVTYI